MSGNSVTTGRRDGKGNVRACMALFFKAEN